MGDKEFIDLCKLEVCKYHNNKVDTLKEEDNFIHPEDVYIVWICKVLQNNKALASTNIPDDMYYELTYNGDKKELYVDAYKKEENIVVKVED